MSGLFGAPKLPAVPTPPPAPSMSDPAIQQAMADEQRTRQAAGGRASTYLTNPQTQRVAQTNQQAYLGTL
jgi:hypothetical protein